jgi:hypothetical protein
MQDAILERILIIASVNGSLPASPSASCILDPLKLCIVYFLTSDAFRIRVSSFWSIFFVYFLGSAQVLMARMEMSEFSLDLGFFLPLLVDSGPRIESAIINC